MELKAKRYQDYNNQVEISIKTGRLNTPENMRNIQAAIATIVVNAEDAFDKPKDKTTKAE